MSITVTLSLFERHKLRAMNVISTYLVSLSLGDRGFKHVNVQTVNRWSPTTAEQVADLAAIAFDCEPFDVAIIGVLDTGSGHLGTLPVATVDLGSIQAQNKGVDDVRA
ncbi:hypothetical protein [Vibrio fluvialis]|uniref:hypothetical protein n=2 Tax=Vibrio fluvialis TaxID=676 RepID=UPI001F3B5EB1|nr:hypothetical protein [Vibrio fluvialis]MCE7580964.1 hypothetical protein [Vibrio fluvialis]